MQEFVLKFPSPSPQNKNGPSLTEIHLLSIYDFLPAIVHLEMVEVNLQVLAVMNVDPITTVHVIWIVVWISGTNKCVVRRISTS